MIEWMEELIYKYSNKGLLIDTNILLLYFVGSFDRQHIEKFKRTSQFTIKDFDYLVILLDRFDTLVTTPNILTEVNNFEVYPIVKTNFHLF